MPFKWGNLGALQSNFDGATPMSKLVQYSQMPAAQKTAATGPKLVDFLLETVRQRPTRRTT